MHLMHYVPTDWLDMVTMRVEGATSSWVNAVLQDVAVGRKLVCHMWSQFNEAMVQQFKLVTETDEARKQPYALRQTGQIASCVRKF